ncbi:hypothetical protein [Neptunomonas concharum]|uniref:Uncharacterized protein n=1 Tax=Neptunomonas concharum TaxID=1031538 RepID=A0A5P1RC54_9GAMM|nr:hypothetical protein [Neptunomonas concharum]QEQ97239.1 hypothetical protein F0U83_11225 [Neptunomonas concharum]
MMHQERIQAFWQRVELTIDQLLHSRQDNQFDADALLSEYRETLQSIDENLTFHFEKDEDEGPIEMIFGCDGYPESIHSVLTLVGAAPDLSGIRFKAFNHRYDPIPHFINVADEVCEIADFWYSLRSVENKLHLAIYMEDAPSLLDIDPRVEAVMIFLDALIGEYELMTRVWSLDWFEMPADPVDFGLKPLVELREGFDLLKHAVSPIGITVH